MMFIPFLGFIPFFWDANQFFGTIDSVEKFHELLLYYDIECVCDAKMAPVMEIGELPPNYFLGTQGKVVDGKLRSFGYRREHTPGTVRLEDWAKTRGMDLRKMADRKHEA